MSGYYQPPSYPTQPSPTKNVFQLPPWQIPNMPAAPDMHGIVNPVTAGREAFDNAQLDTTNPAFVGTQFINAEHAARANAQQSLAGIAGYQFQNDDPTTQQDESLQLNYDPNANINSGDRSRQTALEARNSVNSNLQGSSFADKAVGSALGRLSLQAQGVVNQYSSTINGLNAQYSNAVSGLMGDLVDSYGADAQYMLDNVPPPAPVPDATAAPAAAAAPAPFEPQFPSYLGNVSGLSPDNILEREAANRARTAARYPVKRAGRIY